MKTIFLIICGLFILLSEKIMGDSLFVSVKNDTVFFYDLQIYDNCIFEMKPILTVDKFKLTLIEKDTSNNYAFCNCYYDFSMAITGLESGSYKLFVKRKYSPPKDTLVTWDVGVVYFDFYPDNNLEYLFKAKQSFCYILDVKDEVNKQNQNDFFVINYPNPFNPTTTIEFYLPMASNVILNVYNSLGQLITKVIDKEFSAGNHKTIFNGNDYPGGIYFYRIISGVYSETGKMILLK